MSEKDLWKWILESYPDETIVRLCNRLGIKVAGFRQINVNQKNFKVLRKKIIQEALHPVNTKKLKDFFNILTEDYEELSIYKENSLDELIELSTKEIQPSLLLTLLLSSENGEHVEKAKEFFTVLSENNQLNELEKTKLEQNRNQDNDMGVSQYEEDWKLAIQHNKIIEKKLVKSEKKNEELKVQNKELRQTIEQERKKGQHEKKEFQQTVQSLKRNEGVIKNQLTLNSIEFENLSTQFKNLEKNLKSKDDEISRLNALCLHLQTAVNKAVPSNKVDDSENPVTAFNPIPKVKVAMIGDPKTKKVFQYDQYDLVIVEAKEFEEQKDNSFLGRADQIWLLTYRTPRSVQKKVRTNLKNKHIHEFATFLELEQYMIKG